MQWFADAKLGIFIHWVSTPSIVSMVVVVLQRIPHLDDYMKRSKGSLQYNPTVWAQLFKESGARCAVLTSKHHDGVALEHTPERSQRRQEDSCCP
jgi:alpha-L-fucosidase